MQQIFSSIKQLYVAIIAGGAGTRFFPISHKMCPKQFCRLDDDNTFIQATMKRFRDLGVDVTRIIVITTNPIQTELANEQLNELGIPRKNILEIGSHYDYAGAMIKASQAIHRKNRRAVVINTPADQFVIADDEFRKAMKLAVESAMAGSPTLAGVKIRDINTVMGCGHAKYSPDETGEIKSVVGFVEKFDNEAAAEELIREDASVCNTGINVWRTEDVLRTAESLDLEAGVKTDALMDRFLKTSGLKLVFGSFTWFDCGTLKSFYDISDKTPVEQNAIRGEGDVRPDDCCGALLMAPDGVELQVSHIKGAAVIVNEIDGRMFVAVVKHTHSQRVGELAADYNKNKEILSRDFSLDARNNRVAQTAISDRIAAVFVGVHRHTIAAIPTSNGNMIISVSNDNATP